MTNITTIIQEKAKRHGNNRKALIPILQGIVKEKKYVDRCDMVGIAKALDISAADVYGVASFYSFIEEKEKGENVIRVCKSITCEMKGKHKILKELEDLLHIKLGETTHDKKFSLLETNCLGLCDVGPAMLINEDPYTHLKAEEISDIIHKYRHSVK